MYSHVAAAMHHVSCVLLNIGMYVLCVSNPALAAKSNKPLLHGGLATAHAIAGVTVVLKFLKFLKFHNCPEIVLKLQIVLKF